MSAATTPQVGDVVTSVDALLPNMLLRNSRGIAWQYDEDGSLRGTNQNVIRPGDVPMFLHTWPLTVLHVPGQPAGLSDQDARDSAHDDAADLMAKHYFVDGVCYECGDQSAVAPHHAEVLLEAGMLALPTEGDAAAPARVTWTSPSSACGAGTCRTSCSHLRWVHDTCSREGGWGAEPATLERLAAEHACPAPDATTTEAVRAAAVEVIKPRFLEHLVDHDAEDEAWNTVNDLATAGLLTGGPGLPDRETIAGALWGADRLGPWTNTPWPDLAPGGIRDDFLALADAVLAIAPSESRAAGLGAGGAA